MCLSLLQRVAPRFCELVEHLLARLCVTLTRTFYLINILQVFKWLLVFFQIAILENTVARS